MLYFKSLNHLSKHTMDLVLLLIQWTWWQLMSMDCSKKGHHSFCCCSLPLVTKPNDLCVLVDSINMSTFLCGPFKNNVRKLSWLKNGQIGKKNEYVKATVSEITLTYTWKTCICKTPNKNRCTFYRKLQLNYIRNYISTTTALSAVWKHLESYISAKKSYIALGIIFYAISCRVYIWRDPVDASTHNVCCQLVKHGRGSVMIRATISRQWLDPKTAVHMRRFYKTGCTLLCKHHFHIKFPYSRKMIPTYSQKVEFNVFQWTFFCIFRIHRRWIHVS